MSDIKERLRETADNLISLNHVLPVKHLDATPSIAAEAHLREAADYIEQQEWRIADLEQWQRDMIKKVADHSLESYREMGRCIAELEHIALHSASRTRVKRTQERGGKE